MLSQLLWVSAPAQGALDMDLNLAGTYSKRHTFLGSYLQTFLDRLSNVSLGLLFGLTLTDTARDRWTFSDEDAIFVS
jgi:hypothetical protein